MDHNRKRSYLWNLFTVTPSDTKNASCNMCNVKVSCGSDNPKFQSLSGLSSHLKTNHPQIKIKKNQTKLTNFTATDNCQSESEPVSKNKKCRYLT